MREGLAVIFISVISLLVALSLIRWFAPSLLGQRSSGAGFLARALVVPRDQTAELLTRDPDGSVRGSPLLLEWPGGIGPHDLLGFRNLDVPSVADVVVIGDSQTYGNNAGIAESWPGRLQAQLGDAGRVYSMAIGGWSAPDYLVTAQLALALRPRLLVVAFYSGNDALESIRVAVKRPRDKALLGDLRVDLSLAPESVYPPPADELWPVQFSDGVSTVFTPRHRLVSNLANPVVDAGWEVMGRVAERIVALANAAGAKVLFTVVPTKERVYQQRVVATGERYEDYLHLVTEEARRTQSFAARLRATGAGYVDLVIPLQRSATGPKPLYPPDANGHPLAAGYEVIATALEAPVRALLPPRPHGLVANPLVNDPERVELLLVRDGQVWAFDSLQRVQENGWNPATDARLVSHRDLAGLPRRGIISVSDPARFGPLSPPPSPVSSDDSVRRGR
ncbi:MAG: GDSL-type esterase/lipase family protein [Gammaproteobacteria bacterium]|nr:GDSL-type esterase/lipase family protein [Gammaproteobacteria bacterium]